MTADRCPECNGPAEVWPDRSGGITVNYACDAPACPGGKPPWDTPRPYPDTAAMLAGWMRAGWAVTSIRVAGVAIARGCDGRPRDARATAYHEQGSRVADTIPRDWTRP